MRSCRRQVNMSTIPGVSKDFRGVHPMIVTKTAVRGGEQPVDRLLTDDEKGIFLTEHSTAQEHTDLYRDLS